MANNPAKILIVGPSWVGDMVMAQSLFISLKASNPTCLIDVLAPAWSLPLLERMPEINEAISNPFQHGQFSLAARYTLGLQLKPRRYDHAIILPNSWKSALIPFFANIPIRTGYRGECRWGLINDLRKLDKSRLTMTVQRFVALGFPENAHLPPKYVNPRFPVNITNQSTVTQKFRLSLNGKILALCPGAEYGPSKRWPASYFAEVANVKLQQGWQIWLFGSEKDKAPAQAINQLTQQCCRDFTGQTSLAEAVDLLSLTDTVIANDSGLMHLAAALDRKVIAIYGSTPPEFAPPLSDQAQTLYLNLPCSPCRKRICPLYPVEHPNHTQCLTGIMPERILELIPD